MDTTQFNQTVASIPRQSRVRIQLVTGQIVEGILLRVRSDAHAGSIELETRNGIKSFLSTELQTLSRADISA